MGIESQTIINQCYILQEPVGSDAFSEIWRATTLFSANQFLLRFYKPGALSEGDLEGLRAAAMRSFAVKHSAIMDVVEVEAYGKGIFISSEYNRHEQLSRTLESGATFTLDHIARFMIELAQGLDEFHGQGLAYGTLNAESVWVARFSGVVQELKIAKPGYAGLVGMLPSGDRRSILENHGYLSPEAKGAIAGTIDARSDVYSLGVLLFRFLAGKMPFRFQSPERAKSRPVSLLHAASVLARRGVPEPVVRCAVRMLRRNPAARYQQMVDFIRDIRSFADRRRLAELRAGRVDPFAELETLNASKARVDATDYVSRMDVIEYFQAVTDDYLGAEGPAAAGEPFPRAGDDDDLDGEREFDADEDDEGMDVDDIVARARSIVGLPPGAEARKPRAETPQAAEVPPSAAVIAPEKVGAEPKEETAREELPAPRSRVVLAPEEATPAPGAEALRPETLRPADSGPKPPERSQAPIASGAAEEPAPRTGIDDENMDGGEAKAPLAWKYEAVPTAKFIAVLREATEAAAAARGSLRFVEEPTKPELSRALGKFMEETAGRARLIEIGEEACAAGPERFFAELRSALRASITRMPGSKAAAIGARVESDGGRPLLGAAPLGSKLFGEDGPDPALETIARGDSLSGAARALARFASKGKPLVLVVRGTERAFRAVHDFLMSLGSEAQGLPICAFAFYSRMEVPEWHILALLMKRGKGEPPAKGGTGKKGGAKGPEALSRRRKSRPRP